MTLQSGISVDQTNEMQDKKLQLIVPKAAQFAYTEKQREWLYDLSDFIDEVVEMQRAVGKLK